MTRASKPRPLTIFAIPVVSSEIDSTAEDFVYRALMNSRKITAIALLAFGVVLGYAETAAAHHRRQPSDTSGIPIANLSHGQLEVMSRHRSAILDLAGRQVGPDLRTRTLMNFVNLQYVYCLWGLVPGSLANEDNPFNECSHSYLAASKALLDHLRTVADNRTGAEALAGTISMEMVLDASALQMCRNGVAPFNTAEIIFPEWANVSFNPVVGLSGFVALSAFGGLFVVGRRRRRAPLSTA